MVQANYAAANAALDAYAVQQAALGSTTIAVQWGAWSAVGASRTCASFAHSLIMLALRLSRGHAPKLKVSRVRAVPEKVTCPTRAASLPLAQTPVTAAPQA